jgi:hypothetical protein
MQPLEHAEQLVGILHVETGAIVADKDRSFAAVLTSLQDIARMAVGSLMHLMS